MYTLAVICCLVVAANAGFLNYGAPFVGHYAAPGAYYGYAAPYIGSSQHRAQDSLGQYTYGYATADGSSKSESRAIDGSVAGGYSYTGADGKQVQISYTAGADGFKATGNAIPKPVEPTPEVAAATAAHAAAKAEAAVKAAAAPVVAYAGPYAAYGHLGAYGHHLGAYGHHLGAYGYAHNNLAAYKAHLHGALGHFGYSYAA